MSPDLIPALDPTPVPGPTWLFQGLLVLTFFLHALFLGVALGGSVLAAVAQVRSRGRAGDPRTVLVGRIVAMNAYGISFAITTGVAPLLFVQVLYPQSFYTATLLVPWVWLGMLGLLAVGYYALYLYKLRGAPRLETRGAAGGTAWLVLSAILFLAIAAVHVAVQLVHAQPGLWPRVFQAPWSALAAPVFVARLAHFLLGAISLAAAVIAWWAVRRAHRGGNPEIESPIARYAWRWLVAATTLQLVGGMLLVLLLPGPVLGGLMGGGGASVGLGLGMALALALLLLLVTVRDPVEQPRRANAVLVLLAVTVAAMSVLRHQVRDLYLAPFADRFVTPTAPQWGNLALFALCLVLALATVAWMVRRVAVDRATGDEAA